jgi:phosphohistidine swiveling domain-containing protein
MNRQEDRMIAGIDVRRRRGEGRAATAARRKAAAQRRVKAEILIKDFVDPDHVEASFRALADILCDQMSLACGAARTGAYLSAKAGRICTAIPGVARRRGEAP